MTEYDRDAIWVEDSGMPRVVREPCVRWGPDPPREGAVLRGGERRPIVKYRDSLRSTMQKRLNR